jgi:hypothetical protein
MIDKSKMNDVERDLVEGLEQFARELKAGKPIDSLDSNKRREKLLRALDACNEQYGDALRKLAE